MGITATRIGCDNAVAAKLTEGADGTPSYGTIMALPGLMSLSINPNATTDTLFYDDGPGDTAATLGKVETEIEKNALSTAEKAFLLGHGIDANGGLVYGANDVPPWVALGFRTLKSNGTYRYVWLYKGKFVDPEEANETKGDSINFQSDKIKGNFVMLNKSYTVGGKAVKPYKYELDEEAGGINPNVIKAWFNQVILPGASIAPPATAAALSVAMAAGTATGATKATITGSATSAFAVGVGSTSAGTVYVGDTPDATINPYTSAADITGVSAGQYVYVYDLDSNGQVVKFFEKQLVAGDIKA